MGQEQVSMGGVPAFQKAPSASPNGGVFAEQTCSHGGVTRAAGLPLGALQPSHASASPAECVTGGVSCQWCPLFYSTRSPALLSRDPSVFSLICLTDMSSSYRAETHGFSHQCHWLGCAPHMYIGPKLFETEGNSGVMT